MYPPVGDYMHEHEDSKKQNIHRIKIIKGHLNAIEEMIDSDAYCVDILNQSLAVQKALKGLDLKLMEGHLNHCVIEQTKKKVVDELLTIYKYKV